MKKQIRVSVLSKSGNLDTFLCDYTLPEGQGFADALTATHKMLTEHGGVQAWFTHNGQDLSNSYGSGPYYPQDLPNQIKLQQQEDVENAAFDLRFNDYLDDVSLPTSVEQMRDQFPDGIKVLHREFRQSEEKHMTLDERGDELFGLIAEGDMEIFEMVASSQLQFNEETSRVVS